MNDILRTIYLFGFPFTAISGLSISDQNKLLISTCSIPLTACPTNTQSIETRNVCINNFLGCPRDTSYLCGVDTKERYIVEDCQPELKCLPGTSFQYIVDSGDLQVHLQCRPCPDDRFEPLQTRSSLFSVIPGCTYKHLPPEQLSPHLVKFEFGSKWSPTKWTCDYLKGYYEKNGHLIINDFPSHSYKCVKKTCPAGTLLRPDGPCVNCSTKLIPKQNFICYEPLWKPDSYLSDEPFRSQQKLRSQPGAGEKAGSISSPDRDEGQSTSPVVPMVVSLLVLVVIIAVYFVYIRRRRRTPRGCANNQPSPPENIAHAHESIEEKESSSQNTDNSAHDASQQIRDSHLENSVQARTIFLTINLSNGNGTNGTNGTNKEDATTPKKVAGMDRDYLEMNNLKSVVHEEAERQTEPFLMHNLK